MTLTLFTKPGCHLCDRAKEVLERCRAKAQFQLDVVDISHDTALMTQYQNDIPVILLDGRKIARHFVRETQVLELLKQSTEGTHG